MKNLRAFAATLIIAVAAGAARATERAAAPAPPAVPGPAAVPPDDVGQDLYNARCSTCHGRDGKAKTPIGLKLKTKDLTQAALWKDLTDAAITKVMNEGTADKAMPSYQGRYSAEETAALVKYLRAFQPEQSR